MGQYCRFSAASVTTENSLAFKDLPDEFTHLPNEVCDQLQSNAVENLVSFLLFKKYQEH